MKLLPLFILLALLPSPPSGVVAHWTSPTTAVIRWEQTSDADTVCVAKRTGLRWVLIDCLTGRRGWHTLPLPPGAPADYAYWPAPDDRYFLTEYKDQSPLGPEYGPYGLEWRYWLPWFGAG